MKKIELCLETGNPFVAERASDPYLSPIDIGLLDRCHAPANTIQNSQVRPIPLASDIYRTMMGRKHKLLLSVDPNSVKSAMQKYNSYEYSEIISRRIKSNEPFSIEEFTSYIRSAILMENWEYTNFEIIPPLEYLARFRKAFEFIPIINNEKEILKNSDAIDICVLCMENQGRSQILELILREYSDMFGIKINIRSRGYKATPQKYSGRPSPGVLAYLESLRLKGNDLTVDQFTEADINDRTILVVLDDQIKLEDWANNALYIVRLGLEDPFPGDTTPVDLHAKLDKISAELVNFGISFVSKLCQSKIDHNYGKFEKFFNKLIISKNANATQR